MSQKGCIYSEGFHGYRSSDSSTVGMSTKSVIYSSQNAVVAQEHLISVGINNRICAQTGVSEISYSSQYTLSNILEEKLCKILNFCIHTHYIQ